MLISGTRFGRTETRVCLRQWASFSGREGRARFANVIPVAGSDFSRAGNPAQQRRFMMRRIALIALVAGMFAPILASVPAHAQATRTWVSGVGDDVNPCSRTAPCKTFAGA